MQTITVKIIKLNIEKWKVQCRKYEKEEGKLKVEKISGKWKVESGKWK